MKQLSYWAYINKEISELTDVFSNVFNVDNFIRDYENVWEWIEGKSNQLNATINISREHNREAGEYDKPLQIKIYFEDTNVIHEDIIDSIGDKLSKQLKRDVSFGDIKYVNGNNFEFVEKRKYKYH